MLNISKMHYMNEKKSNSMIETGSIVHKETL